MNNINSYSVQEGFFVVSSRRHTHHDKNIATAILMDHVCAYSAGNAPIRVWKNELELIEVRRQTSSGEGAGSAHDTAAKKWITLFDFEEITSTTEDSVRSEGSNEIILELSGKIVLDDLPAWFSPVEYRPLHKMSVVVDLKAEHLSDLSDWLAHESFLPVRHPGLRSKPDTYYQECSRLAQSSPITAGMFLPVQWAEDGAGVLEITAREGTKATCLLWVGKSKEALTTGTMLKRQSGWKWDDKVSTVVADVGKVNKVIRQE